ncbi:NAD(P)-binding protein [Amanita rubescens]|nr:NAD(P)-binding protein [Amanita rubescens]
MASVSKGIAIVTGSAGALGKAIVLRLAEDGYDIALHDDIRKKGRKAIVVVGDITVESDVKKLVETTIETLGGLDIMIANAGIYNGGPFLKSQLLHIRIREYSTFSVIATVDDFDKIFAVNVRGTYLCFRYAAEKMITQGRGGRLLAASSVAGETGEPFTTLYCATKWAVRGLITSVAKEVGRHGITVNAYAPGIIGKTPMWGVAKAIFAEGFGLQNQEAVDEAETANTAVGYLGKPEDVANLVSFLVKKESHFITGQTMSVNGGSHCHWLCWGHWKAIVLRLAEDGYDIALSGTSRSHNAMELLAEDVKRKGKKAIVVVADVTVESDVKNLVETTVQKLGGLDIMVANAGILGVGAFLQTTVDTFEKTFAVNVRGTYLCFRYAAEKMIAQGRGGRLLAASSVNGLTGTPFLSIHCSTKWAIRGLVTSVAKEVGRHGITVNAYAPGIIKTPMWEEAKARIVEEFKLPGPDTVEESEKNETAVGYLGEPEDVASLVSFLCKKESHFITGQTMSVNGGKFVQ